MITALLSGVLVFMAVYFATKNPLLSGLLAVVPIKIVTTLIATDIDEAVLRYMLIGQFLTGGGLLALWLIKILWK